MAKGVIVAAIVVLAAGGLAATAGHDIDPKGYITFCPCMGEAFYGFIIF